MFSNANSCVKRTHVDQLKGNDINFDGGYGEDTDFGISLIKTGIPVLFNPFSANLHLKPPAGGYRFWGNQAKKLGKKRKQHHGNTEDRFDSFLIKAVCKTIQQSIIRRLAFFCRLAFRCFF